MGLGLLLSYTDVVRAREKPDGTVKVKSIGAGG